MFYRKLTEEDLKILIDSGIEIKVLSQKELESMIKCVVFDNSNDFFRKVIAKGLSNKDYLRLKIVIQNYGKNLIIPITMIVIESLKNKSTDEVLSTMEIHWKNFSCEPPESRNIENQGFQKMLKYLSINVLSS